MQQLYAQPPARTLLIRAEAFRRFVLLVLLCCAGAGPAHARVEGARAPLALFSPGPVLDTAGHLERLDDPGGVLDAAQADRSPHWQAVPDRLSASYTDDAVWLRLQVQVQEPGQWMLLLSNALLDDVQMFARAADGSWRSLGRNGEDIPRRLWPVDFRSPALQLDVDRAGPQTVLLRLRTRNALKTGLAVWPRLEFDNQTRREGLFFGLYFGFYLLLIGLHTVFWRMTRAPLSGIFVAYIGVCVLNQVLTLGLVQQITGLAGAWSDRLLGLGMSLVLPIAAEVALRQLELPGLLPRTTRALRCLVWGTALAASLSVLTGHFAAAIVPVQWISQFCMVFLLGLALWWLRRGHAPAGFFLLAFGPFYAGNLAAYLLNLGYLPLNVLTEHISALGTMVHMVLMSLWLLLRHDRHRRARDRQRIQLQAELAQRAHAEAELLRTLDLERQVRQEQHDFVAMLSHELRTPLAIITTSAQQLERNLTAPPARTMARAHHIRAAAQRLLGLVDGCLADDRMAEPGALAPLRLGPCDLGTLLHELRDDFAPGRIAIDHDPRTTALHTDSALLRIAVRNLLANADRHAPADEAIQVQTRCADGRLCIDVANTAPAIPPAEQQRLFERYFRGQNAQQQPGSGLGLYLVQRIAAKLGGRAILAGAGGAEPVRVRLELPVRAG
ncbi:sensor histidine kinase [Pseudorhodoferax sp.]|uniref:sensor histidine kinase n=1 Tax=Pseudorhodoferax sp. TaxID=1993553 RepID=UPI002DD6328A|nr:sensor histidine kinase [Pseudorhodoferax sp.]